MTAGVQFLTRDQILDVDDLAREAVDVPEWGGQVMVLELNGTERDLYQHSLITFSDDGVDRKITLKDASVRLCAMSIVDGDGVRVFSDSDVAALGKKSARALDRVYAVAQRLSALTDEDVEEIVGNSEGSQADDSTSD